MTTPALATRVMKARHESTCPNCKGPIRVGQVIAKCAGGLWQHATCLIGHRHTYQPPEPEDQS